MRGESVEKEWRKLKHSVFSSHLTFFRFSSGTSNIEQQNHLMCVYVVWRAKASSLELLAAIWLPTTQPRFLVLQFRSNNSHDATSLLRDFPYFIVKKEQSISSSLLLTATLSLQRSEHTLSERTFSTR